MADRAAKTSTGPDVWGRLADSLETEGATMNEPEVITRDLTRVLTMEQVSREWDIMSHPPSRVMVDLPADHELTDAELCGVVGGAAAGGAMAKIAMTSIITGGVVSLANTIAQAKTTKALAYAVSRT